MFTIVTRLWKHIRYIDYVITMIYTSSFFIPKISVSTSFLV
jgi:hypothetical protein